MLTTNTPIKTVAVLTVALTLLSCKTGTLPDPNDPNDVTVVQPEVLRNSLKGASDALNDRVASGEIDRRQYERYMAEYANELLGTAKIETVPSTRAWEYAEVFRTAERWQEAEKLLERAVKAAKIEDRRVNDSLRLAQVQAKLGKVATAVKTARSVFNAPPQEKAPILTAVLLEIVPSGEGKGGDVELAKLLEDAIPQAELTVVDPNSDAGKAFIIARPHHIRNAWSKVIELYETAGRHDLAVKAMRREEEISRGRGTI